VKVTALRVFVKRHKEVEVRKNHGAARFVEKHKKVVLSKSRRCAFLRKVTRD
jgi:hypothetical protein